MMGVKSMNKKSTLCLGDYIVSEHQLSFNYGYQDLRFNCSYWFDKINLAMHKTGNCFFNSNLLYYDSFAPARANQLCKWFLNGEGYMEAVMNGLNNAKEEIYITDWWLCPELFLKRPTEDLQYRLDKILLKKAKEGVKIYILLFKELSLAIGLESSRAKSVLTQNGKNPNIKILRHPGKYII